MDAGQYYGFNKTFRDPDTSYPHKKNDLVVKEQFKKGTSDTDENWVNMFKNLEPFSTSLKIFKQYKLKPSFSIIKDNKDKVGVGDKPPPPSFSNMIRFDPI